MRRRKGPALLALLVVACPAAWPASGEQAPMSLADCMAYALSHNPRIAAAVARVEGAQAGVSLAGSGAKPVVTLSASERLQGPIQEITIPVPGQQRTIRITRPEQRSVGIGVVWPLWTGGRTAAALGAARAQVDAAEADLQQATEQLLYEVGTGYYLLLSARAASAAADASVRSAEEALRAARIGRDAGAFTGAELAAAVAAYERALREKSAARNAVADAEQVLNRLMARPQSDPVVILDAPLTLTEPVHGDEAVQLALSTRPELLALAHRQQAAQAAIAAARAERNPTIRLAGGAARQTATDVVEEHQEFVAIEFSWPVFSSVPAAQEQTARAASREIAEIREDLEGAIASQVAEAERRLSDARGLAVAAEEALRAAEQAAREADVAYQAGAITRQQLLAAEAQREQTRAWRAQASNGISVALLSYVRALGLMRALFVAPPEGGLR